MMITRIIVITLLSAVFFIFTQAQTNNPDLQRELNLEKEYSPTLREVHKINQLPEIKAPEAPKTKVEFSNYVPDYAVPSYYRHLDAKTYFPDFATNNKRGYLDVGIGSLIDVDVDLGYQILNLPEDYLSIFGSHRSSNPKTIDLRKNLSGNEKQKMKLNDNLIGINYLHRFETVKLLADAQYTHSAFNYYGLPVSYFPLNPAAIRTTDAIEHVLDNQNNRFQIHAGVESVDNEAIAYKANLAYTLFDQKFGETKEIIGKTENQIRMDFDLFAKFIGIASSIKNYSYRASKKDFGNSDYTAFSFNPYLIFKADDWNARLGINADLQTGGIKNFRIAPDIRFNWRSSSEVLFYLSAKGGTRDNSNYNCYDENRYIDPLYRIYDTKIPFDGTVGIRFSPSSSWGIDLFTGYKWMRDEHFYLSERFMLNVGDKYLTAQKIVPQYAHAQTFKLGGILNYSYQDIFDLGLKWVYQKWNVHELSNIASSGNPSYPLGAWNKPVFTGDLNMGFKVPAIPFRVDLAYHLEAGRKTVSGFNEIIRMKNIHDLNLKGNYTFNDTCSVFVKINNLLYQKYDLFYGYPAQNFNIMGGISLKF
jgi:hypothetical protein